MRMDMNEKHVEMHLIMNKYLIEPEQEVDTLGGTRASIYNLLLKNDNQPLSTTEDLNK